MLALADITARASGVGLTPVGGLHPDAMPDIGTIVLLGPDEPGFWPIFTASPESRDGAADPM
ncbi:MAG TPA: ferredoxin, partial [Amaricoccus sp.]|nr:ferredoxin [Amaricoccus sp.]